MNFNYLVYFLFPWLNPEKNPEWDNYKLMYGKNFDNETLELKHQETYYNNLKIIKEHNEKYEKGEVDWFMKENEYTDLTFESFADKLGLAPKPEPRFLNRIIYKPNIKTAPASFDWRSRNGINPVKNQGSCGSCWAFSAISALESRYFVTRNKRISLSEQQLVDCSTQECKGGWMPTAYDYIQRSGINTDAKYKYVAKKQKCAAKAANNAPFKLTGYYQTVSGNEDNQKFAVAELGALAVGIHVTKNFQLYGGGILNDATCNKQTTNHAVTIVGYGASGNKAYWIVRNSWGGSWGEKGYIRMSRNKGGQCGIANYGFSPILK